MKMNQVVFHVISLCAKLQITDQMGAMYWRLGSELKHLFDLQVTDFNYETSNLSHFVQSLATNSQPPLHDLASILN